jgi:transcriptional regulator with XRE-family HTH domain
MSVQRRFCEKARQRRGEMGWTQRDLAHRIGVTQPTVSGWESGHHRVDLEDAVAIAQALGMELTEMIQ